MFGNDRPLNCEIRGRIKSKLEQLYQVKKINK